MTNRKYKKNRTLVERQLKQSEDDDIPLRKSGEEDYYL
jgi:hypothetical protein